MAKYKLKILIEDTPDKLEKAYDVFIESVEIVHNTHVRVNKDDTCIAIVFYN